MSWSPTNSQRPPNAKFESSSGRDDACDWMSVVRSHELTIEHAAVDIDTDHVLYHMKLEFTTPLPIEALDHAQFLCLTWPYGGLWKIERVSDNNTKVKCLAWRKTELKHDQVDEHARQVSALDDKVEDKRRLSMPGPTAVLAAEEDDVGRGAELETLFRWKMMRGEWGSDAHHWYIRDILPPEVPIEAPARRQLVAKLFVGFAPLEARIEVDAVTAIDTIAQTYSADLTWQVTLPAITAIREDTVLLEFMDLLEIDATQFEFNNINEMKDERTLTSSVTPAGRVQFRDLTLPGVQAIDQPHVENVYHLQFSRRVIASFTEEMDLHSFPFDQQKLIFEFSTGSSGMPDGALQLIPAPVEPGSFSIEDFQLGNVFDVAYHNKIFVSDIKESGPRKMIAFEMVLERRSYYYLANVALIAAVITYLCFFVSWSPENREGQLMDIGSRLQNVTAMVLTAVTFKNQVASLIPQISYFTILDSYVFICFMVTSFVTVVSALFPLVEAHIIGDRWKENGLLGYSLIVFTVFNVAWALYLKWWLTRRRYAAKVLMLAHEHIRLITDHIPAQYREEVLQRFLESKKYEDWCKPKYLVTSSGDIHVQAPDDRPSDNTAMKMNRVASFHEQQLEARAELAMLKKIYSDLRPTMVHHVVVPVAGPSVTGAIPAAKTTAPEYQAGALRTNRLANVVVQAASRDFVDSGRRLRRAISDSTEGEQSVLNLEVFRRLHDTKGANPRVV